MKIEELFDGKFYEELEKTIKEVANKTGIECSINENGEITDLSYEIYKDYRDKAYSNEYVQEEILKNWQELDDPEKLEEFISNLEYQFLDWAEEEGSESGKRSDFEEEVLDSFEEKILKYYGNKINEEEIEEYKNTISEILESTYQINFYYDFAPEEATINIPLKAYVDLEDYATNFCDCSLEEIAKGESDNADAFEYGAFQEWAESLVFMYKGTLMDFLEIQRGKEEYCMVFKPESELYLECFTWCCQTKPEKEVAIKFENIEAVPFKNWNNYFDGLTEAQRYKEYEGDAKCETVGEIEKIENIREDIFLKEYNPDAPSFRDKIKEKEEEIESQEVNCR